MTPPRWRRSRVRVRSICIKCAAGERHRRRVFRMRRREVSPARGPCGCVLAVVTSKGVPADTACPGGGAPGLNARVPSRPGGRAAWRAATSSRSTGVVRVGTMSEAPGGVSSPFTGKGPPGLGRLRCSSTGSRPMCAQNVPCPVLRFFFDAGSGGILWATAPEDRERWGNPIDLAHLPISRALREELEHLVAWHDTSLNWDHPPGSGTVAGRGMRSVQRGGASGP